METLYSGNMQFYPEEKKRNDGCSTFDSCGFVLQGYSFGGWGIRFRIDKKWFWYLENGEIKAKDAYSRKRDGEIKYFKEGDRIPCIPVNHISVMVAEAGWIRSSYRLEFKGWKLRVKKKNKWYAIFPYHVTAFIITFITIITVGKMTAAESIVRLIKGLPNFLFIQRTGIYADNIIGVEWYVSVMLLSLFLLYPICRRYYDVFTRIIAPLSGVFLVGYLCQKYGYIPGASLWDGLTAKAQIRGMAGICLGAFLFEVSRFLRGCAFTKVQRRIAPCTPTLSIIAEIKSKRKQNS